MRVFFNAIVVQIVLNAYILWWFWNVLSKYKTIRNLIAIIFGLELVAYIVGFLFTSYLPLTMLHWIVWICTTWIVFILYFSVLLLGYDFLRLISRWKKHLLPKRLNLNSKKTQTVYFFVTLAVVLIAMFYGNYRFRNPVVTELNLTVKKEAKGINNLKVVMVSDIHIGTLIGKDMLAKYVDMIMEQKPDVILMVGDIIDYDIASVEAQHLESEFHRLSAPYGVYASTGNHEYIKLDDEEKDAKVNWLSRETGFTLLRDSTVKIADAFYLVGREDDKYEGRKSLSALMEGVDKSLPVIVLNHEPNFLDEEVQNGADIALYGHTHNGQLFPYNIVLKARYEVVYGYKRKQDAHIYVSSGLGLAGPQYRIGTLSEIVVLNIKFEKD